MITSTTMLILIVLTGSVCITAGFVGRGVSDAGGDDHLRHDWRLVLGPARPVESASNARTRTIRPAGRSLWFYRKLR